MRKIMLVVLGLVLCGSCFAEILNPEAPLVYYHQDTGVLLLDTNGVGVRRLVIRFNNGEIIDYSPDNPLFESCGGLITEWEYIDPASRSIYFGMYSESGYFGSLGALCQISSGLSEEDFGQIEYRVYPGDYYDAKYTDIIMAPESMVPPLFELGGDGTPENPYQISTKADLLAVNNDLAAHYILANDIDLTGQTYTSAIIAPETERYYGSSGTIFEGSFNGNGFAVRKLTIIEDTEDGPNGYKALFGSIGSGGEVSNLGVENCSINGSDDYYGGLCGWNLGNISNCYATGILSGRESLGGICGYNEFGSIIDCYSTVSLNGDYGIGGLCGYNYSGNIIDCYASGSVSGYNGSIGGLCGYNLSGNIVDCYATGNIVGDSVLGGLCGVNKGIVNSCYANGDISGEASSWAVGGLCGLNRESIDNCYSTGSISGGDEIGGLCGTNSGNISDSFWDMETSGIEVSAGGTGKTTLEMRTQSTFTDAGWDFVGETANGTEDVWEMPENWYPLLSWQCTNIVIFDQGDHGSIVSGRPVQQVNCGTAATAPIVVSNLGWMFDGWDIGFDNVTSDLVVTAQYSEMKGSGTAEDPYQISTKGGLDAVNNDLSAHYVMTQDIDLAGYIYNSAVIGPRTDYYPYGGLFKGVFDGKGFAVRNLTIIENNSTEYQGSKGLFRYIAMGGKVLNLGVENCKMNIGSNSSSSGILCGYNNGSINNCYTTGSINRVDSNLATVGGICGRNSLGGDISNSYSECNISGVSRLGGLCGFNLDSTINNCYATGSVNGSGDYIGGICGYNMGSNINNCYATGSVSGDGYIGGVCGLNYSDTNRLGRVIDCYATGKVSGNYYVGGVCGYGAVPYIGNVLHCFWDIETSEIEESSGGIGKTTLEMQTKSTFTDYRWDFVEETANGTDGIWKMPVEGGYPLLYWQPTFTVTFIAGDNGTIIEGDTVQMVDYGYGATAPTVEADEGWYFMGWDCDFGFVESDLTLTAEYRQLFNGKDGITEPLEIFLADELEYLSGSSELWDSDVVLEADIDCSGIDITPIGNAELPFNGTFNGAGFTIKNLSLNFIDTAAIGLFGVTGENAVVKNLGVDSDVTSIRYVNFDSGIIAGHNKGLIDRCYTTGNVHGYIISGGIAGYNTGEIRSCYSLADCIAYFAGGVIGENVGMVENSYCSSQVICGINNGMSNGCVSIDTQTLQPSLGAIGWDGINNNEDGELDLWYQQEGELPKLFWQWQPVGDIDYNGVIDTGDLAVMMNEWLTDQLQYERLIGDINLDNQVTLEDFAIISVQWASE